MSGFRFERVEPVLAAALCGVAVALTLHHAAGDSATTDEPVHLAAAVEIVREGTGRWNPEHPPLAKALAGLALSGTELTPAGDPIAVPAHAPLLVRFLYRNGTPAETILWRARLPFALLLGGLLLAIRAEARRRFGPAAGLAALAFAAVEPNLIGHAGVVHTDVAVTFFVLLSLGPLDRLRDEASRWSPALLGLAWGLAFLSKFNAPLLVLATLPLLLARAGPIPWSRVARGLSVAAVVAATVALAGFGAAYRHQSAADRDRLANDRLLQRGGSPAAASVAIAAGNLLPAAGQAATGALSVALQSRVGAGANFFCGRVSREGSAFYFPLALATKVSLGLALAALAGAACARGRRPAAALGAGLGLVLLLSAGTTYNIGVRHVLFAFPFAALAASAAASAGPRGRLALAVLWGVAALELASVHPHELSFFNAAAGGPEGGRRFFADSNVDWGQELGRLAREAPRLDGGRPVPAVVFGGDFPGRHAPALRAVEPGDEDREGAVLAVGEVPFAVGPELLRSKGATADAARLDRLRSTLTSRGTRIGSVGGSIGIWRVGPGPLPVRGGQENGP